MLVCNHLFPLFCIHLCIYSEIYLNQNYIQYLFLAISYDIHLDYTNSTISQKIDIRLLIDVFIVSKFKYAYLMIKANIKKCRPKPTNLISLFFFLHFHAFSSSKLSTFSSTLFLSAKDKTIVNISVTD